MLLANFHSLLSEKYVKNHFPKPDHQTNNNKPNNLREFCQLQTKLTMTGKFSLVLKHVISN